MAVDWIPEQFKMASSAAAAAAAVHIVSLQPEMKLILRLTNGGVLVLSVSVFQSFRDCPRVGGIAQYFGLKKKTNHVFSSDEAH